MSLKDGSGRWVLLGALVAVLGAAGFTVRRGVPAPWTSAPALATAQVQRGDFEIAVKARGEVKAVRSVTLAAPTSVNEVKLVKLAKAGSTVKAGEVVVEIDATQVQTRLQEQESAVKQADAEIEKARAQARIQDEQDRLDLAQAEFDVERARLEVSKQEIVSEIEAGKAKLALESAQRKLAEVKERIAAHQRSQAAEMDQVTQKRKKAEGDVNYAKTNLQRLTIRSPISGILTLLPNWSARSNWGESPPEFKAGDRAWPGAYIAEIPDMTSLAVELFIEETDRGKIAVGQPVRLKLDALADQVVRGKLKSITPLSEVSYQSWPPQKTFRGIVSLESLDSRLRPGMSAGAEVVVDKLRGVTLISARASFDRAGKVIAYVKNGRRFEPREITIGQKNEAQVEVLKGLQPGETVALEEPASAREKL